MPFIANINDGHGLCQAIINDTNDHSVKTENNHGTNGDIDNGLGFEPVFTSPYMDDGKDREKTNNEV